MLKEGLTFLLQSGTGSNNKVEVTDVGEGEPASGFGSKLGDGRVKLDQRPPGLGDDFLPGGVIEADAVRDEINPDRVHKNRSETARAADKAKDAEVTTDPLKWASAPNEYDYPGVDTGPQFDDTFDGGFDDL